MSPFLSSIHSLMLRDIAKLEQEIGRFQNDGTLWQTEGAITNSAGNLALHLAGNLQHYIGAVLGGSGYVRHRDAEFSTRGLTPESVLEQIAAARKAVERTLPTLREEELDTEYPERVFENPMTTRHFLIHLTAHLGYHLGQVNYLRRFLLK